MNLRDIRLGTRLELEILEKTGEKVSGPYVSQLLEHQNDGLLVISAPIFGTQLINIPDNMVIHLTFVHAQYGLIGITALVKSKQFRGKLEVLLVEPVGKLEKIQRRSNFRLDINSDVLIWLINPKENKPIRAYAKNISGSGLCVVCDTYIPKKTKVKIELSLPTDLNISAECVILRVKPAKMRKGIGWELGMHYTDISKNDQDALVKFIFDWQRMLIKKREK
jgi:c-di-GMP-binding flagellar brake protein YcgR